MSALTANLPPDEWVQEHSHRLSVFTIHGVDAWAADLEAVSDLPNRDRLMEAAERMGAPRCRFMADLIERYTDR